MGSYDGAELCELIRIYTQPLLTNLLSKDNMSLYRENVLFILCKISKQQTDRVRIKTNQYFRKYPLQDRNYYQSNRS